MFTLDKPASRGSFHRHVHIRDKHGTSHPAAGAGGLPSPARLSPATKTPVAQQAIPDLAYVSEPPGRACIVNRETAVGGVRIRSVPGRDRFLVISFEYSRAASPIRKRQSAFEPKIYIYRSFHSEPLNIVMPVIVVTRR
jgi:hypothetical protein